ncbi:GATOR complex protein MIOS isoform X2 [Folsomia candida]|uniref:GATOR complex protein MIOS isoform X2 n=1 Tax=Folsomia candida TaxID=158441 RepID=UPI000B904CF1|nr:GATOR complex protein MIOS isoform X2 [Folsomia candida]
MDLQWSPKRSDHLVIWSQDITLYQIEECGGDEALRQGSIRLSDTKAAAYLAKITDFPYSKVVEIYPGDVEGLIACGLVNGKIALTSFLNPANNKEIAPKHPRQVLSVQWNKLQPNLLAAGFEKARSDHAVAVWDVTTIGSKQQPNGSSNANPMEDVHPLVELGINETASSLSWVLPKSILIGMNGKHIKLFDLRDSQPKLGNTTSTKAVNGISVDTLCHNRVVSYAENQAFVWDMRNFEKPFVVLNHSKPISKVAWCPTRSGLLACLEKDSTFLTLHDVHHAALSEEGDPAVLERRLYPAYSEDVCNPNCASPPLCSFAWHCSDENLITTCTPKGVLWNSVVFERMTLNWSSTSKFGWSNGKKTILYIDNTDKLYTFLDDISVKMRQRAIDGYGLKTTLRENGMVVQDSETTRNIWLWLDYCKALTEKEKYLVPSVGTLKYPGVRVVLRIDSAVGAPAGSLKSEVVNNTSFDLHNNKTYRSEERSFIQQLCGWNQGVLQDLQGSPTRRAAIALFHLKMRQAIKILNESNHSIVAMAIAGFNDDESSLWRELAQSNCNQLDDPYIRAIFAFLTESDSNYETILKEKEISLADRMGFACSFLPDGKLISFVNELTHDLIKTGNLPEEILDAVLLTGMTTQAIPLLQKYVDYTADIQTVALLVVRTMALEISNSSLLKLWTERYRELLDSWKLWEQRAEFDIVKNTNNPALVPQPEVSVSCNFCGKSISSTGMTNLARSAQLFNRFSASNAKLKLSCCPSCRKPLPRCSICLMHMGTILGTSKELQPLLPSSMTSSEAVACWYTWCQSCRHGGHTLHLQHWFETQAECPVSGCTCKCITLDRVVDFSSGGS